MARLYICHEPVPAVSVAAGAEVTNQEGMVEERFFILRADEISETELCYICFVHEGNCWAARSKVFFSSGRQVSVRCVLFNDDPSGKLMLLKDTLLS